VGKSAVVYYQRSDSLVPGEASDTPSWAVQVVQDVNAAASHYPKIENGYWWVWDVTNGIWVNTMVKASGAEIDPADIADAVEDYMDEHPVTVPVQSVNGKTGAVVLGASDVGALPSDTPIPVVPQMATQADMSDWTSGKTVDAAVLKEDFQQALAQLATKANANDVPTAVSDLANDSGFQTAAQVQSAIAAAAELPSGGSTGDFLRKTASGVAWQTVPSAESNSFGGGT